MIAIVMLWDVMDPIATADIMRRLVCMELLGLAQAPDRYRRFSDELGWIAENLEILLLPYLFMLLVELNLGGRRSNPLK